MNVPLLKNAEARCLFLARHGLAQPFRSRLTQAALAQQIEALGLWALGTALG